MRRGWSGPLKGPDFPGEKQRDAEGAKNPPLRRESRRLREADPTGQERSTGLKPRHYEEKVAGFGRLPVRDLRRGTIGSRK
jgi:hypothetical protein